MQKYDLIVAGGGFAGVAAALSAAREGCKVLLLEKGNSLGGAATNCLVNPFMQYWTTNPETNERVFLSKGIFEEMRTRNIVGRARDVCNQRALRAANQRRTTALLCQSLT